MYPKVSIIMTSYNKPLTVGLTIESIIAQTLSDWELFVMDDNSDQLTVDIIKGYLGDKRIRYFNSMVADEERYKKTRYAVLINQAIRQCTGKYIIYVTDDVIYKEEKLKTMVEILENDPKICIAYNSQLKLTMDEKMNILSELILPADDVLRDAAHRVDHCSVMHTKELADRVNNRYHSYWPEQPIYWYNADSAFWKRLNEWEPFYPIHSILEVSYETVSSFQQLKAYLPDKLPNGLLVKALKDDIYLIENQKRRWIAPKEFNQLKYRKDLVISIPSPFLYQYQEGPPIDHKIYSIGNIPNERLVQEKETSAIYYLEKNKKRYIPNQKAFQKFRFNMKDIVPIDKAVLDKIALGIPLSGVFELGSKLPEGIIFSYRKSLYWSINGSLHPINRKVLQRLNKHKQKPVQLKYDEFTRLKIGPAIVWEFIGENGKRNSI
ncbi:glycosyltransferase family 2 protein [Bacillus mesophilum]|uniref:glycosyltransferase family 2 protein n=1 Tax=Bacillus mesophilum TaxID=1071718 RepID=UPI0013762864|nr:glycosyltransferase family 2 protein [Bacillus mesophilum]